MKPFKQIDTNLKKILETYFYHLALKHKNVEKFDKIDTFLD